jgi:hypothetical protein
VTRGQRSGPTRSWDGTVPRSNGSTPPLRLVVREGMIPVGLGIAAGAVVATMASLSLERLVFGVSASDPRLAPRSTVLRD